MEITEEAGTTTETEVPDAPPAPPAVIPPSERPKTGVEREAALLTPAEVDSGQAAYRQTLPAGRQVPAEPALECVPIVALGAVGSTSATQDRLRLSPAHGIDHWGPGGWAAVAALGIGIATD